MKRREYIRQLLEEKKLGSALSRMDYISSQFQETPNDLILTMGRYNRLKQDVEKKVIYPEQVEISFQQILNAAIVIWENYFQNDRNPMLDEIVEPQDVGEDPVWSAD
ncbi:MAG: hypothetical protein AAF206_15010 [Bacteroidota bacterium]